MYFIPRLPSHVKTFLYHVHIKHLSVIHGESLKGSEPGCSSVRLPPAEPKLAFRTVGRLADSFASELGATTSSMVFPTGTFDCSGSDSAPPSPATSPNAPQNRGCHFHCDNHTNPHSPQKLPFKSLSKCWNSSVIGVISPRGVSSLPKGSVSLASQTQPTLSPGFIRANFHYRRYRPVHARVGAV